MKWEKVTESPEVIEMIKEIEELENKIREIDPQALMLYHLELINNAEG